MTESKETLIAHYLGKADKVLAEAEWLVGESHYELAANRYYYACFHALQALFLHDGLSSKTHSGVQHLFFEGIRPHG